MVTGKVPVEVRMFSAAVLDRFYNPRNSGPVEGATHRGMGGLRGEGPYVELWLEISGGRILKAGYETYGCPAIVACGSVLCEVLIGKPVETARAIQARDLETLLGGLPEGKGHCPELAMEALRSALEDERR